MFFFRNKVIKYIWKEVSIAPLVVFRLFFGALMCYSIIRFYLNGWIESNYILPQFYFPLFDWQWVQPLSGNGMYIIFVVLGISSFCICIGFLYRINTALFFLLFTYTELIDKTYYLNHYYLVCLLSFWMMLVNAHHHFSIDSLLFPKIKRKSVPQWQIVIFKLQLSIVYFFAGLGKVNPDWLFHAEPMRTWLPSKYQLPLLGKIVQYKTTAFLFSWMGCLYDLSIWFFLLLKKTRKLAYLAVIVFHVLTSILFPQIGMFPYIMMVCTIIFFATEWHEKVLSTIQKYYSKVFKKVTTVSSSSLELPKDIKLTFKLKLISLGLGLYVLLQLYLPFRYLYYPGNLLWHEQGFRFSWRVMLIEKAGTTAIIVEDPKTKKRKEVKQCDHLTAFQQKQMSSQPDMILQYVHFVGDQFLKEKGYKPQIFVKSNMKLNGRRSMPFINDTVDLYSLKNTYKNRTWVFPLAKRN